MKIPARLAIACCTAFLIAAAPPVARSASKTLVLADAEPQYASHLCWAAADTLAVNNFYQHCPSPPGTLAPGLFPTSQAVDAGYHAWVYSASPPIGLLSDSLAACESNIQAVQCNDFDIPPLRGLTSTKGFPPGTLPATGTDITGLSWAAATQEIQAGRPFLFMWDSDATGTAVGLHQFVATGYSDDTGTQRLQIWDPLPVPKTAPSSVPACGPAPGVIVTGKHSKWIDFSIYAKPVSYMGVPVIAAHDQDLWDLAMISVPDAPVLSVESATRPVPPVPPLAPFHMHARAPPPPLAELRFAKALDTALPESQRIDLQVSGAAPRSVGVPFPIVGLHLQQLLRGRNDPTGLLAGSTSAILFPVESGGEVVDAFLMLFIEGAGSAGAMPTSRSRSGWSMCAHATPRSSICRSTASIWFRCRVRWRSLRPTGRASRPSSSRLRRIP